KCPQSLPLSNRRFSPRAPARQACGNSAPICGSCSDCRRAPLNSSNWWRNEAELLLALDCQLRRLLLTVALAAYITLDFFAFLFQDKLHHGSAGRQFERDVGAIHLAVLNRSLLAFPGTRRSGEFRSFLFQNQICRSVTAAIGRQRAGPLARRVCRKQCEGAHQ